MSQLKEMMRLENEEQERLWDRKQKQNEFEINELKERVKLKSREMEKHQEETEIRTKERKCIETREIEGELDGVSDEHTHTEVARLMGVSWRTVW